jgi:uncharacterized membrane protein
MRKHFVTGLAILLPVVLTAAILIFLVNLLTKPFIGMLQEYIVASPHLQAWIETVPGAGYVIYIGAQVFIIACLVLATALLGLIARWFFFRSLIRIGDSILHHIPVVNKLYKTSQDIIKTVFAQRSKSFKEVVMVPFPRSDVYSLGLVASDAPPVCKSSAKRDLVSVFVPTTPNPTSGYLLMFPREECLFIDMRVEDAIKFIISCGVIHEGALTFVDEVIDAKPVVATSEL